MSDQRILFMVDTRLRRGGVRFGRKAEGRDRYWFVQRYGLDSLPGMWSVRGSLRYVVRTAWAYHRDDRRDGADRG